MGFNRSLRFWKIGTLLFCFGLCVLPLSPLLAERSIVQVFQPTSLLGTECEDKPLSDEPFIGGSIIARPVVVGSAFPEAYVAAIALPHHIAGAPENFPKESNLIVLVNAKIEAQWGEKEHVVVLDFSKATKQTDLGVSLLQVMKLTVKCLELTLKRPDEKKPIRLIWKLPIGQETLLEQLPLKIRNE